MLPTTALVPIVFCIGIALVQFAAKENECAREDPMSNVSLLTSALYRDSVIFTFFSERDGIRLRNFTQTIKYVILFK